MVEREEKIVIDEAGNTIPIKISREGEERIITIDGVEWVRTNNITHAAVLFNMMREHITEYMTYKKI
jgi:hypothetical protein